MEDELAMKLQRRVISNGVPPPIRSRSNGVVSNGKGPVSAQRNSLKSSITSYREVPQDLSGLSLAQVGDCLKLLKLDKYVEKFRDESIDGAMLVDLELDILEKDLGMSGLNATKLKKFVGGWRPNDN